MNEFQGASAVQREPFFDPQTMKETPELEPLGLVSGPVALELCEADAAFALAGGPLAFTHARLGGQLLSAAELRRWAEQAGMAGNQGPAIRLEALTRPRSAFAGRGLVLFLCRMRNRPAETDCRTSSVLEWLFA